MHAQEGGEVVSEATVSSTSGDGAVEVEVKVTGLDAALDTGTRNVEKARKIAAIVWNKFATSDEIGATAESVSGEAATAVSAQAGETTADVVSRGVSSAIDVAAASVMEDEDARKNLSKAVGESVSKIASQSVVEHVTEKVTEGVQTGITGAAECVTVELQEGDREPPRDAGDVQEEPEEGAPGVSEEVVKARELSTTAADMTGTVAQAAGAVSTAAELVDNVAAAAGPAGLPVKAIAKQVGIVASATAAATETLTEINAATEQVVDAAEQADTSFDIAAHEKDITGVLGKFKKEAQELQDTAAASAEQVSEQSKKAVGSVRARALSSVSVDGLASALQAASDHVEDVQAELDDVAKVGAELTEVSVAKAVKAGAGDKAGLVAGRLVSKLVEESTGEMLAGLKKVSDVMEKTAEAVDEIRAVVVEEADSDGSGASGAPASA